jgi:very-short-patch-repair endonuclease
MQKTWKHARHLRTSATDAERLLWHHLRSRQLGQYKFRRQYPIAGYIADFVCVSTRLVVELDGGQHVDAALYDAKRTQIIEKHGYRVLRFWNDDVLLRTNDVLEEVLRRLHDA